MHDKDDRKHLKQSGKFMENLDLDKFLAVGVAKSNFWINSASGEWNEFSLHR